MNPEEAESSAGDDAEASLELEEKTSVSWVCCPFCQCGQVVLEEKLKLFCGSPDHIMKDCPKDLSKTA